jgi:hypothetical protein
MGWWRRRRRSAGLAEAEQIDYLPVPRVERAIIAMAVHAQQLDDRLERLERRLDASIDSAMDGPSLGDVLEVRLHSARVAAELTRVTVELKAGIDHAISLAGREPSARERRRNAVAETIVDLSDRLDTLADDVA